MTPNNERPDWFNGIIAIIETEGKYFSLWTDKNGK